MISNRIVFSSAALLSAWTLVQGCSNDLDPSQSDALGTAQAAVNNVPSDGSVACISVTSTGSWSTTQAFDVLPGQSTVFTLTGIPIGTVRFDGYAYATSCAQVTPMSTPTWVSTPVLASVVIGQTTAVTLNLQQAGNAGIGVGFTPEPACRSNGLPCLTGSECCSASCGSNSTCQPAPGACGAGLTSCNGSCVDTSADVNNCGACGLTCPLGDSCNQGACGPCPDGGVCGPVSQCGDGLVNGAESCDDGNTVNGDGCDASCAVEAGFICFGAPSVCFTVCGDGIIAGPEQCDDGNVANGDGCSAACTIEASCVDGLKNGTETDIDCGGGCAPCAVGHMCVAAPDCTSSVCVGNTCMPPTCTDGVKNGTETDLDCGGGTCFPCSSAKNCAVNADCASGVCVPGLFICQ